MASQAPKRPGNDPPISYPAKSKPISKPDPGMGPVSKPQNSLNFTLIHHFPEDVESVVLHDNFQGPSCYKMLLMKPGRYSVCIIPKSKSKVTGTTAFIFNGDTTFDKLDISTDADPVSVSHFDLPESEYLTDFAIVYQTDNSRFAIISFTAPYVALLAKENFHLLKIKQMNDFRKLHLVENITLSPELENPYPQPQISKLWPNLTKTCEFVAITTDIITDNSDDNEKSDQKVNFRRVTNELFPYYYAIDDKTNLLVSHVDIYQKLFKDKNEAVQKLHEAIEGGNDDIDEGENDGVDDVEGENELTDDDDDDTSEDDSGEIDSVDDDFDENIPIEDVSEEDDGDHEEDDDDEDEDAESDASELLDYFLMTRKQIEDICSKRKIWPNFTENLPPKKKNSQTELIFSREHSIKLRVMSEIASYRYHVQNLVVHSSDDIVFINQAFEIGDISEIHKHFPNLTKLTFFAVDFMLSYENFAQLIKCYPDLTQLVLFIGDQKTLREYYCDSFWQLIHSLKSLVHLVLPFDYGCVDYGDLRKLLPEALKFLYVKGESTLKDDGVSSRLSMSRNKLMIPDLFELNRFYDNDDDDADNQKNVSPLSYVNVLEHFVYDFGQQRYTSTAQISMSSVNSSISRETVKYLKNKFENKKNDLITLNLEILNNPALFTVGSKLMAHNGNDLISLLLNPTILDHVIRLRISQPSLSLRGISALFLHSPYSHHSVQHLTLYHFNMYHFTGPIWQSIGAGFPKLRYITLEECIITDKNESRESQPFGVDEDKAQELIVLLKESIRYFKHLRQVIVESSHLLHFCPEMNYNYTFRM